MAPIVLDAATLRRVIVGFHGGLADHRQVIDNLNVYPVPDGDTGTNMTLTHEVRGREPRRRRRRPRASVRRTRPRGAHGCSG